MKEYLVPGVSLIAVLVTAFFGLITAKRKFRDDLQAKYDETVHDRRIEVYQDLWKRLEVLATYAPPEVVTPARLEKLSQELREWYFQTGGLFLTDNSRDTYFALQDSIVDELAKQQPKDQELGSTAFEVIRKQSSNLRASLSSDLRSRRQPEI